MARPLARFLPLLGALAGGLVVSANVHADPNPPLAGKYRLRAETKVKAPSQGFEQTFRVNLDVTVTVGPDDDVVLDVRHGKNGCILQGKRSGREVVLPSGQTCAQAIDGEGFRAELDAVLTSGSAKLAADGKLTLTTEWQAKGNVHLGPVTIPASGTVLTKGSGPKKK